MRREDKIRMTHCVSHKLDISAQRMLLCFRIVWGIVFGIIVLLLMVFISIARAEVLIGYGSPIMEQEKETHKVIETELLTKGPKPWTFSLVGQFLEGKSEPHEVDGQWYNGTDQSFAAHARVGISGRLGISSLNGRLFGGFGLHSGNQVEIGNSGILGHIGIGVGLKVGHSVAVGYSIIHMSDPLRHHDFGWNYQLFSIEVTL